jgi:hypothetical protein
VRLRNANQRDLTNISARTPRRIGNLLSYT